MVDLDPQRYVVETPVLENVTEEIRAVVETVWPELMSKLPPSPEMPLKMRPTGLSSGFYSAWRSDSWSFRALRCPRVSGW